MATRHARTDVMIAIVCMHLGAAGSRGDRGRAASRCSKVRKSTLIQASETRKHKATTELGSKISIAGYRYTYKLPTFAVWGYTPGPGGVPKGYIP